MTSPDWLKPGISGARVAGVVGVTRGGRVTGSTAKDRAMAMVRGDVVASMVPVRLDRARVDAARTDKLATIPEARTCRQRTALRAAGRGDDPRTRCFGP